MALIREDFSDFVNDMFSNDSNHPPRVTMFMSPQGAELINELMREEIEHEIENLQQSVMNPTPIPTDRFPLTFLSEGLGQAVNEEPEFNMDNTNRIQAEELEDLRQIRGNSANYITVDDIHNWESDYNPELNEVIEGIPIQGFRDVGTDSVLFIGGPADKEIRACQHPWYEVAYSKPIQKTEPVSDGKYREEKTLVIDSNGNEQWIGWSSDDQDPMETPRTEVETYRYKIMHVSAVIRGLRCVAKYGIPRDWEDEWYNGDHSISLMEVKRLVESNNTGVTPRQLGSMFAPVEGQFTQQFARNPIEERQGIMAQIEDSNNFYPETEGLRLNAEAIQGEYTIFSDPAVNDQDDITDEERRDFMGIRESLQDLWEGLTSPQETETDNDNEH